MAWVYILKTEANKYYVGSTQHLQERLKHHRGGYTPSTKSLGFCSLLLSQEFNSLKDARWIEKKLKSFKRKDYIEKIIEDGYIKLTPP